MAPGRGRWTRRLAAAAAGALAACSQASAPRAPGDDTQWDVEASTLPPQPDAGLVDSYGYGTSDAYAALTVCAPFDASAPEEGAPGADAAWASDAATARDGDAPVSGCEPLPPACAGEPDCVCLLVALGPSLPCAYPRCDVGGGFTIYCP